MKFFVCRKYFFGSLFLVIVALCAKFVAENNALNGVGSKSLGRDLDRVTPYNSLTSESLLSCGSALVRGPRHR